MLLAVIPSVIVGLPLNDWMDEHLMNWAVVSATLIIYGVLFIVIENHNKRLTPAFANLQNVTLYDGIVHWVLPVALVDSIPGTSRSGATILGASLDWRLHATSQLEFSFFMAIPTMFGASLLKLVKFFAHGGSLAGFAGSSLSRWGDRVLFVVAYLSIRFLLDYIKKNDFKAFGWYRIVLGVLVIGYFTLIH